MALKNKKGPIALWLAFESTVTTMKFAVALISIFGLFMIAGTFIESYYGTEFVGLVLYKAPIFIFVQALLFLSILLAMLKRFPLKKRLYGFYVIHTGLVMVCIGSYITWVAGIDGSITLGPNTPARELQLSQNILKIRYGKKLTATLKLPANAFAANIGEDYKQIKILDYFPFAATKMQWQKKETETIDANAFQHSSEYFIGNDNVSQKFILSLDQKAPEFKSNLNLGPLTIHYLPSHMEKCFKLISKHAIFLWDEKSLECFTPEQKNIAIQTTPTDHRFLLVDDYGVNKKRYHFFPDLSPWPLDKNLKPISDSSLKVFGLKLFQKSPHLFLFGESIAYYDKTEKKWSTHTVKSQDKSGHDLPWMGFKLKLLHHTITEFPQNIPHYQLPIQKNGRLVKGNLKALKVEVQGKTFWITNEKPLSLLIDGQRVSLQILKESYTLPFEFVLKKFQMNTSPGTMMAASYESFVNIFSETGTEKAHIYMNNPFKKDGLTFYQASYFKDPNSGQTYSTLSVNADPGRFLKYLGSLLLVLGTIWHFTIQRKKTKKKVLNT